MIGTKRNKHSSRRIPAILAAAFAATLAIGCLAGCTGGDNQTSGGSDSDYSYLDIKTDEMNLEYTKKDLDDSYDSTQIVNVTLADGTSTADGEGVQIDGDTITFAAAGDYLLTGTLSNGQLVVNVGDDEKVHLVFAGVNIANDSKAAIYVENADKTIITADRETDNVVSDVRAKASKDDEDSADGAIYAKDDISFNGAGNLTVTSTYKHAIATKDDFTSTITGTMTLSSGKGGDGIHAKDSAKFLSGTYVIDAQDDAVQVTKDDDGTKGFIAIDGGTYQVSAKNKGFKAETVVFVNASDVNVTCSEEGLEAEQVIINDGNVVIASSDDGINASVRDSVKEAYGLEDVSEPDKIADKRPGFKPGDGTPDGKMPEGATPPANEKPEGVPAPPAPQKDDATEAPDGQSASAHERPQDMHNAPAGDFPSDAQKPEHITMPGAYEGCLIQINGGSVLVNAEGDGLDSNGSIEINGGTVIVNETSHSGDSALDFEYTAEINGGDVWLIGATPIMHEDITGGKQASLTFENVNGNAGCVLEVRDSAGTTVGTITSAGKFAHVIFSSANVIDGAAYTLYLDGAAQAR